MGKMCFEMRGMPPPREKTSLGSIVAEKYIAIVL